MSDIDPARATKITACSVVFAVIGFVTMMVLNATTGVIPGGAIGGAIGGGGGAAIGQLVGKAIFKE